jgi:hypothetical protein
MLLRTAHARRDTATSTRRRNYIFSLEAKMRRGDEATIFASSRRMTNWRFYVSHHIRSVCGLVVAGLYHRWAGDAT